MHMYMYINKIVFGLYASWQLFKIKKKLVLSVNKKVQNYLNQIKVIKEYAVLTY